jgi:hypothetical protein
MKTIATFESNVIALYDELEATLEATHAARNLSDAEILCVLGNMVCAIARDSGVSCETFVQTMEMTYLQDNPTPANQSLH